MIVCVCRAVCDRRLRTLAADGHRTLEAIAAACGAGDDCGTCRPDIEQIIDEAALLRGPRAGADTTTTDAPRVAASAVRTAA